jgi:transposase InsO family protein
LIAGKTIPDKVLDSHRNRWGIPVGVLCDHGSANISADVQRYFGDLGIEPLPLGPGNPKSNGTEEGVNSQLIEASMITLHIPFF